MATEEMAVVVQSNDATQSDKTHDESQYSIYNYLKEHTAFLVACVSAFVAVISFALNFAADQYTGAYLQYWMVDTVYAKENKTELIYVILFTLFYSVAIIIAHKVMSGTANTFGFYNRILSALNWYYRDAKKEFRAIRRETKKLMRKHSSNHTDNLQNKRTEMDVSLKEISSMKRTCELWLFFNVVGSALIIFGLVYIVAGLMTSSRGDYRIWGPAILSGIVVAFDLFLYFIPAFRSSRVKKRDHKEISLAQLKEEMQHADKHRFPIASILHTGAKELLSNKRFKQFALISVAMVVMLFGLYSSAGKTDAEKAKEFPIYTDETGTYAVVYNNGDTLVLKAANIENAQIEINVRQQKIVSASDISYEIRTFETVIVTGKDGEK